MSILDIIYNMVNKSKKKKKKKSVKRKKKIVKKVTIPMPPLKEDSTTQTMKKIEEKIVVQDLSDTNSLLSSWKANVKNISEHPLSQVKVINTSILEQLTTILTSMELKLDKLNMLDEILFALKESRTEVKIIGGSTEKIDKAITTIENLTIKDEEVLRVINDKGPQTADTLSRVVGISRSTASTRLNKLYHMKLVKKNDDGKYIYYSLISKK